ncbi:osteocalcin 2-like isoform X4 [Nilaparvata lugens]|uniref:osteocalcin 2-like isoform X4 n=1 Tax=Nilaparvata lugens TaxID=108931 RepID=UPI00193C9A79|nr:osteocalcin 2-like isoform X4 [Nilaparvata lugens]
MFGTSAAAGERGAADPATTPSSDPSTSSSSSSSGGDSSSSSTASRLSPSNSSRMPASSSDDPVSNALHMSLLANKCSRYNEKCRRQLSKANDLLVKQQIILIILRKVLESGNEPAGTTGDELQKPKKKAAKSAFGGDSSDENFGEVAFRSDDPPARTPATTGR